MEIVPLAADDLDEVEPIWSALREHHAEAGLSWIGPVRERADSWARRRADYARWLGEGDRNFVLLAPERGRAVGDVAVTPGGGAAAAGGGPPTAGGDGTPPPPPAARGGGGGAGR